MTLPALLLITISAFGHAFWNFFSKRRSPAAAFFWIASLSSALLLLPMLFLFRSGLPYLAPLDWLLIGMTGIFQASYYIGLAGAYSNGDLSLAYPLARALPVLLVTSISIALGRGSQISPWALPGFFAIFAGCIILPLPDFTNFKLSYFLNACCLFAVLAAFSTTGYTLSDDHVLRSLRTAPGIALDNSQITLLFMSLENLSLSLALGVWVLLHPRQREILRATWRTGWMAASFAGLMMTATYGLVLAAMAYVSNVSYVSAFRQLSIPIGAALGIIVRKEPRPTPKLVGLGMIVFGLIVVALSKR